MNGLRAGELLRPLPADALRIGLVLLVVLRDVRRERVVGVWRAQQRLYRKQDCADLECWRPLVWEFVSAQYSETMGYAITSAPFKISRQIRPSLSKRVGEKVGRSNDMSIRERTDVGMVDLGEEAYFGRCHRVLFREEELKAEYAVCPHDTQDRIQSDQKRIHKQQ